MKPITERLLQAAAILVFVYIGWNLSVSTVVTLIRRNVQVTQLSAKLQTCEVALKDVVATEKKTEKK